MQLPFLVLVQLRVCGYIVDKCILYNKNTLINFINFTPLKKSSVDWKLILLHTGVHTLILGVGDVSLPSCSVGQADI